MKAKYILATAAIAACICSFGINDAAAQKKAKTATPENAIVPQVNPLVIEVESFEGHSLSGERSYITIYDNTLQGRITNIQGMVRTGRLSGRDALVFNKCEAEVGEPTVSRKGNSYTFDVRVEDALFFNANPNTDWNLSITVYLDGRVSINISSASIMKVYGQNDWQFSGHINGERIIALKQMMEMEPSL